MTIGRENIRKKKDEEAKLKQSMSQAAKNKQSNRAYQVTADGQDKEIVRYHRI